MSIFFKWRYKKLVMLGSIGNNIIPICSVSKELILKRPTELPRILNRYLERFYDSQQHQVYSKTGKKLSRKYKTKAQATKRLRQIEWFKKIKAKGSKRG